MKALRLGRGKCPPQCPTPPLAERILLPITFLGALAVAAQPSWAQEGLPHEDCQNPDPWATSCSKSLECDNGLVCIRNEGTDTGTCRAACVAVQGPSSGDPDARLCAYGEACVSGEELGARETRYCKPVPFSMDLNLLDSCIYHFVEGLEPKGATDTNVCSLTASLARMLERDGSSGFSIYDFDQCILDFLAQGRQLPCDGGTCIHCISDDQCGEGAFCNTHFSRCERECGLIVDRSSEGFAGLQRTCSGRMKVCNEARGRCEDFVLGGNACTTFEDCERGADCLGGYCEEVAAQCDIDRDCMSGAYCFLGECQPKCFRSLDCPDSQWFCSEENECQRKPAPGQPEGFVPERYGIVFGVQAARIDPVNDDFELPLMIMDTESGRPVFGNGNILFGYRMQVTYGRKQDPKCVGDLTRDELTEADRADCVISPREEFLTLSNPFGTIYGDGRHGLRILLNDTAAADLSPGRYQATIRAVFSNGTATSMTVLYEKPMLDGLYRGPVEIAVDDTKANLLALADALIGLRIDTRTSLTWDELLNENNIINLGGENVNVDDREFRDITSGFRVEGAIYGNSSTVFNNPRATTRENNEIPIRGLYSPQYRRMRLISVVDIPADARWCRDRTCQLEASAPEQLLAGNAFGRDVRRKIEWIGTFDAVTRQFAGTYRETLSGLFPSEVTLQGTFSFSQTQQNSDLAFADDSAVPTPLLPPNETGAVGFPPLQDIRNSQLRQVAELCEGTTAKDNDLDLAAQWFSNRASFLEYMTQKLDESPMLPSIRGFGGRVAEALADAGDHSSTGNHVSIADLLRDSVQRCEDEPDAPICVDVRALTCGLALHAKALTAGDSSDDKAPSCRDVSSEDNGCRAPFAPWVDRSALVAELSVGSGADARVTQAALICPRRPSAPDPKCDPAAKSPTSAAFQEYLWFFKSLQEVFSYEAGQNVSDAFFQLYRDEYLSGASALDMTAAYRQKVYLLKDALSGYDDALALTFDPATSLILFDWPMSHFEDRGEAWLQQMHAILSDRTETLREVVDLQRRVIGQEGYDDTSFYQHVFQQEYLSQVFLAVLQAQWQGAQFSYAGQGPSALQAADRIMRRIAEVNNPLGLRPNRTYFENGWNSGVANNIELFRQRATEKLVELIGPTGNGGLIQFAKEALRSAVATKTTLIDDLDTLKDQLDDELLRLCGEDTPLPDGCADLSGLERTLARSCIGEDCPVSFACEDERCERVTRVFSETLDSTLEEVACRADTPLYRLFKNPERAQGGIGSLSRFISEDDLDARLCVRGQVGSLLQERASLELSRQDTLRQANDLLRQLAIKADLIKKIGAGYDSLNTFLAAHEAAMTVIEEAKTAADVAYSFVDAAKYSGDCITILGWANGDNCISKSIIAANIIAPGEAEYSLAQGMYAAAKVAADTLKTVTLNNIEATSQINRVKAEMDSLTSQVESLIGQYQMVVQQMRSTDTRIADTLSLAQSRWNAYSAEVHEVAASITGEESRWSLLRNSAAMEAQQKFQSLLLEVYKLVQAVAYRYELPEAEAVALRNRAYQLVTAGQVSGFLADIDCRLRQFAAGNDLDAYWDDPRDSTVFLMSLREELFPSLTEIVDPDTGNVLTAGEQFHRIITAPPYLRRVVVNGVPERRIVIPFATWMDVRADSLLGQPALVDRNTCNQVLVGDATRESVAVNFEMWNARPDDQGKFVVHSWLSRGTIDHMRSCSERYPMSTAPVVRSYTFGNAYHDTDVAIPYLGTRFEACVGGHDRFISTDPREMEGLTCWKNAFRERTLGSPNWLLEIGRLDEAGGNGWLLNTPADQEQPIIRDIEIAFRYTDRAMGTTTFQCHEP